MITIIRKGVRGTMKVSGVQELRDKDYIVGGASRGHVERKNNILLLGKVKLPIILNGAALLRKIKSSYKFLP